MSKKIVMQNILKRLQQSGRKALDRIFKNSNRAEQKFYYNAIEIAAKADANGTPQEFIKIVPVGKFPTHPDGPHEITPLHIQQMAANITNGGTDILFDFGHESLYYMGAEAAGWSPKDIVQAKADGLYIKYPAYTTNGQLKVDSKAYRYFSPVYCLEVFDKDGTEIGAVLHSVGLVNTPYLDTEIDNIGNSKFKKLNGDQKMNKSLLKFLGLAENATEADVTVKLNSLRTEYKLADDAGFAQIIVAVNASAIEGAKVNAAKKCPNCGVNMSKSGDTYTCPDCGTTMPVSKANSQALSQEEITNLINANKTFVQKEIDRVKVEAEVLVNSAITDGKIKPEFKDQYITDAIKNFAVVKADLDKRKKNSALPETLNIDKDKIADVTNPTAIAKLAREYKNAQEKLGNIISYPQAVNHIWKESGQVV